MDKPTERTFIIVIAAILIIMSFAGGRIERKLRFLDARVTNLEAARP